MVHFIKISCSWAKDSLTVKHFLWLIGGKENFICLCKGLNIADFIKKLFVKPFGSTFSLKCVVNTSENVLES